MADYDWFKPKYEPDKPPEWSKWRSAGFHPLWFGETLIGGGYVKPDAWGCRRGCGTLVWDPKTHIENVCRNWEPRVGNSSEIPKYESPVVKKPDIHHLERESLAGVATTCELFVEPDAYWTHPWTRVPEWVTCVECRATLDSK